MAYLLYGFQDALDWVEAYKSMEGSVFTRCLLAVSRHTTTRIGGYLNMFGQACSRTWDNSIFKSSHYDPYDSLCPNLLDGCFVGINEDAKRPELLWFDSSVLPKIIQT